MAMRRGTAIDRLVLGGRLVRCDLGRGTGAWRAIELMAAQADLAVYPGPVARGKEYEAFVAGQPDGRSIVLEKDYAAAWDVLHGEPCDVSEIVTSDEYETANRAAQSVLQDPVAAPLLVGEKQRVFQWDMHGLPWAAGIEGKRGGFDVLGAGFINDLKTTVSTEPGEWSRHARKMLYPEQLAAYRFAARAHGLRVDECYVTGVEVKPPYAVTVLRLTPHDLEMADRRLYSWCERIRQCEAADFWPGYSQSVVDIEPESIWDAVAESEEA
jgi:hypothetical protein